MRLKRPRDPSQLARHMVLLATGQIADVDLDAGKNPAARESGKKGGKARAAALPPAERQRAAKKAAAARWAKKR